MIDTKHSIYKHTCPDGHVYIGQTGKDKLSYRWGVDGSCYKYQPDFYSKIEEFGWDNILHEEIYSGLTTEEANIKEVELIESYGGVNDPLVLNAQSGGTSSFIESNKTKEKIGNGVKQFYEKHPERREVCRDRMIERYSSQEERNKQSETMKKMYEENPDKLERVRKQISSQEMIEKSLEAKGVKIDIYDKDFNFIKTAPSVHHASRDTGIGIKAIRIRAKKNMTKENEPIFMLHGQKKINPLVDIYIPGKPHPVCQIDIETKTLIAKYNSCSAAATAIGENPDIASKSISAAAIKCQKYNKFYERYGFYWQFVEDYDREIECPSNDENIF